MMITNQEQIRVSVIIPVYNGERYLAEAIQSVRSQKCQAMELLVVDDGSTDRSADIVRSFNRIQYIHQLNQGTAAARNKGLEVARGEFIGFLDADDVWTENRLHSQLEAFAAHPELDAVSGQVKQFLSPELDEDRKKRIRFSPDTIPGLVLPAMLIRRKAFFQIGMFDTKWELGAEMNWYLQAREAGIKIMILPDLVLMRRLHESNKGITRQRFITQRAQILKASLDRRRGKTKA